MKKNTDAYLRKHSWGVDYTANNQGNRTTPSYVAFTTDERMIGDAAKNQIAMNVKNTVVDAKRLIGRRFSDPVVRAAVKHGSFEVVRGLRRQPADPRRVQERDMAVHA